jgi:hypothetical protein
MKKYLTMDIGGTFIKYSIMDSVYQEESLKSMLEAHREYLPRFN